MQNYHRRAFAHNYHAPFIYHIILKGQETIETFGELKGSAAIAPGQPGCAYIENSSLGRVIATEIKNLQTRFKELQVYQFKVMPDHVHLLLRVKQWTNEHLDYYIDQLTRIIAEKYSQLTGKSFVAEDVFQPGYCDKPLLLSRSLDDLFTYIRHNPHRLAMRRQFPQFFQMARHIAIGEGTYIAYGNLFLLRNPDKIAVKISRSFTPEEKHKKRELWLEQAKRKTILVSPFISEEEKGIRAEAEKLGASIILFVHQAFEERFKPAKHDFELCSQGRLLIISLGLPRKTALTRQHCVQMNELAATIAEPHTQRTKYKP